MMDFEGEQLPDGLQRRRERRIVLLDPLSGGGILRVRINLSMIGRSIVHLGIIAVLLGDWSLSVICSVLVCERRIGG
jgi:hypothetical protein